LINKKEAYFGQKKVAAEGEKEEAVKKPEVGAKEETLAKEVEKEEPKQEPAKPEPAPQPAQPQQNQAPAEQPKKSNTTTVCCCLSGGCCLSILILLGIYMFFIGLMGGFTGLLLLLRG